MGMILTGVFSSSQINAAAVDGLAYGGTDFFLKQLAGCGIVVVFSLVMSFILFKIVDMLNPIRVSVEDEEIGLDVTQHAESL